MLLAAGHSLSEILDQRQDGLPYAGWTLPQYGLWLERAVRHIASMRADAIEAVRLGIAASFDETAGKKVSEAIKKMRSLGG